MFLMFCSYLLPVQIMPEISERLGVSKSTTGSIIAMYPLGAILAAFVIGKYQSRMGKIVILNSLTYCFFVSMLMFGFAMTSSNKVVYLTLCFFARFL